MIDSHCHLDRCDPPDPEWLDRVATVGMDDENIAQALGLAEQHEKVYAIVGRHPNSSDGFKPEDIEPIAEAARHPKAVAIGETGLDYFRNYSPREDQQRAFEAQIELAHGVEKPLVIHTRAAEDDTLATLGRLADGLTVVMHCFSMPDRLDECVERGYVCSFAGNVTYKKATELQEAAARVPDELLLVETDAPYLSPEPLRGKPNHPRNVEYTARRVAELRGVAFEELETLVAANAARVFGW